jgi:hypothetical protein
MTENGPAKTTPPPVPPDGVQLAPHPTRVGALRSRPRRLVIGCYYYITLRREPAAAGRQRHRFATIRASVAPPGMQPDSLATAARRRRQAPTRRPCAPAPPAAPTPRLAKSLRRHTVASDNGGCHNCVICKWLSESRSGGTSSSPSV